MKVDATLSRLIRLISFQQDRSDALIFISRSRCSCLVVTITRLKGGTIKRRSVSGQYKVTSITFEPSISMMKYLAITL